MRTGSVPTLANDVARRLFLHRHGLSASMSGAARRDDLHEVIDRLGFVQIDSINTVARAHHMILASRRSAYKEPALKHLLEKDRRLFEHWTHDASVIPVDYFPHWRLRFSRDRARLIERWRNWQSEDFEHKFDDVLKQISDHGPVTSSTVGEDEARSSGGWWEWHPSKTALEFLWRSGELSVCGRNGFQKVYDLTERVIPEAYRTRAIEIEDTIDWAARSALDRLGFATSGEIAAFWDLITPAEAKAWCDDAIARGEIVPVDIACVDGKPRRVFVFPATLDTLSDLPEALGKVRILSPFDPALRDRKRAERLFGFFYRIEIFVPEKKRQYGYYVFPVMEGDTMIGRIDMKAFRDRDALVVRAFWPEPGIRTGKGRLKKLETELARMARFSGCGHVAFEDGWMKEPEKPGR